MKPREFHEFASECLDKIHSEASSRSAISRAYYAALLRANNLAEGRGVSKIEDESPHKAMIERFAKLPGAAPYVAHLYTLKDWREAADYTLTDYSIQNKKMKAITMAKGILDWIDTQPQS